MVAVVAKSRHPIHPCRQIRNVKRADLNAERREIEGVADTAWPHADKANASFRRAFKLFVKQSIAK